MFSFGRVQSQAIIDSFNRRELTVVTDGREELLINCLKSNQPCAEGLDRFKGLLYVVFQGR